MDEKLNRMMPRNKTGIYASEIRHMLVPNTAETQRKMSSGNQRPDLAFRKHSAFKVSLKPRLALATVNTKLMEQQRPNTKESNLQEFVIEDDSDKNSNTFNETENYIDSLIANKHRFRPSAVLRRNKLNDDRSGLPSSRSSSSKSISLYNRNKNTIIYPEITKSLSPIIINRKEIKISKNEQIGPQRQKSQLAKENFDNDRFKDSSESDLMSPKTKTDATSMSNGTNLVHSKTKLDLFKEIYENLHKKGRFNQFKENFHSKKYSLENVHLSDENTEMMVNNLNEEEFVNLLKEYRKTHELNVNSVVSKTNRDKNEKLNSNLRSSAKIINLKGEFERCSTFANIYSHSNSRFPAGRKKNQFVSGNNEKFLINANRLPDYFVNYLNNKILVRTSAKSYVGFVAKKSSDFSNAHYRDLSKTEIKSENDIVQTFNEPSPSIQPNDNLDNQKFQQQLKILNIPTTAN